MQNTNRDLTTEAFNRLLALFDVDVERAGEKYELIRMQLVRFFQCRGCYRSHELTDETINRVARKLMEGQEISPGSVSSYFYGVARNILREYLRSPEKRSTSIEDISPSEHPSTNPYELNQRRLEKLRLEQKLDCINTCLKTLPPEARSMILSYYQGEGSAKITDRKQIAESLEVPLATLRIRIHRIREKLETCVTACLRHLIDE